MPPLRPDSPALQDAIADAISTATRGAGRVNILIAGKTGVGKSTLINAVFRGELARTGAGKPVTQTTQEYTKPGHPLTIIDTRGLEVGDYARSRQQLTDLILRQRMRQPLLARYDEPFFPGTDPSLGGVCGGRRSGDRTSQS